MEQIEVIDHNVSPNRVTKFMVKQTIVKEKEMTYNTLSKLSQGEQAFKKYVQVGLNENGEDIRNQKNFKLCNKSKKDHEKCKNVPRKKRRVTRKKTKSFQSMNRQSFPENASLPQEEESSKPGENQESVSSQNFHTPLNNSPEKQNGRLNSKELREIDELLNSRDSQSNTKNRSLTSQEMQELVRKIDENNLGLNSANSNRTLTSKEYKNMMDYLYEDSRNTNKSPDTFVNQNRPSTNSKKQKMKKKVKTQKRVSNRKTKGLTGQKYKNAMGPRRSSRRRKSINRFTPSK
jgi:hypothetical protein